ncbi:MAG: hypothetical protein Q7K16_01790 [Candidatus Azambacteria bacterium]|nr:hypothetical protein [Candidatus Azambacteria bacterium]
MTLASHIIISGLLGASTHNYFLAAIVGFFSHYIVDAIPHWDAYLSPDFDSRAKSKGVLFLKDKFLYKELSKVAIDIIIGLGVLSLMFFETFELENITYAAIGVFFGVLPDPLQLLYLITNWRFLKPNHKIQIYLHTLIYKGKPSFWPGILTQAATILLVFLITF